MAPLTQAFRFIPLSPVHIGSGQLLEAEDYILHDGHLVAFDTGAIIRSLSAAEREQLERLLEQDLSRGLDFLRGRFRQDLQRNGGRSAWELYRVRLGESSRQELQSLVENPQRRGEVYTLIRNPYTKDVIIPGSAIKGAIRTAVLNLLIHRPENQGVLNQLKGRVNQADRLQPKEREKQLHKVYWDLQELTLGVKQKASELDPFRFLRVSDATWPAEYVQIDRAILKSISKATRDTEGIQLHVERLLSQADGVDLPDCRVVITIDRDTPSDDRVRPLIRTPLDWGTVEEACNDFYVRRFNAEQKKFHEVFGTAGPECPWWPQFESGDILLRVGRFSHFDSLSVDDLRSGWNAQRHRPIRDMGTSRTVCQLPGQVFAPFGWVVLRPIRGR